MTRAAERHLSNARDFVARGEDFYRKAAEEIVAAQKADPTLGNREIGEWFGRSKDWVRDIVRWSTTGESTRGGGPAATPYAEQSGAVAKRHARAVLREAPPEQIAELLAEPAVREKVRQAETIATTRAARLPEKRESEKAFRNEIGEDVADDLENLQALRDVSAELTRARVALNSTLQRLNGFGIDNLPDSWREEYLRAFDEIAGKCDLGRGLITGALDVELDALLAGEV